MATSSGLFAGVTAGQLWLSAAANGAFAYYIRKKHPHWALFFAINALVAAEQAVGKAP
jgi:hypothetical protein